MRELTSQSDASFLWESFIHVVDIMLGVFLDLRMGPRCEFAAVATAAAVVVAESMHCKVNIVVILSLFAKHKLTFLSKIIKRNIRLFCMFMLLCC